MGTNIMSGIGASVDAARQGMRCINRSFSQDVPQETRRVPLAPGVPLRALAQGSVCSLNERGEAQPFDPGLPFCGLVIRLVNDGKPQVVVHSRGAVLLTVEGLRAESMGKPVHALANGTFALEGGAVIGEVLTIERLDRELALVGFKRFDDQQPFILSGRLMERER